MADQVTKDEAISPALAARVSHIKCQKETGFFDRLDLFDAFDGQAIFESFSKVGLDPIRMMEAEPIEEG